MVILMYRKTYALIDLDVLKNNIKNIKEVYNDYKYYIGVVKGNAYGHGDYIVNSLIESGINYLAVSSLEEAISIREYNKDIPILKVVYLFNILASISVPPVEAFIANAIPKPVAIINVPAIIAKSILVVSA